MYQPITTTGFRDSPSHLLIVFFLFFNSSRQAAGGALRLSLHKKSPTLNNLFIFARRIGSVSPVRGYGLKGNRAKIPNSPAAVKLRRTFRHYFCHWPTKAGKAFRNGSQSEDLPFMKGLYPRGLGYGYEKILESKN